MMNKRRAAEIKATLDSLTANSSIWMIFKKDFFGWNFININGRASRKEWWMVTLFSFVLMFVAAFVYSAVAVFGFGFNYETASVEELNIFLNGANLINMFLAIPSMAVGFRRFHDLDMSAWWSLLILPNFMLPFVRGKEADNRFGKNIY